MGFGMTCESYLPEDLLQITVYEGGCGSKVNPIVTYMHLDTCLTPPRLPISGVIPQPGGSLKFSVGKAPDNSTVLVGRVRHTII
jgi:hypothetical protein